MEVFRSLGLLSEVTGDPAWPAARALGFDQLPAGSEFTDLFSFQLVPYASVYLGAEGMLGGEARDRIAGFWRAMGESPPPEPDHLAVLLAAYAELVERESGAGDSEVASRWHHARRAFLWEHLLPWLPPYLDKAGEVASGFYQRWSKLLSEVLVEEASDLGSSESEPLCLREAPALEVLEGAGADQFLEAITAPIRTGLILTRVDLERCATELGLGARKGERRYILKALLAQAPRDCLDWLAEEADRWSALHGNRPQALAPLSSFWRERSMRSAELLRSAAARL